jgi:hypothetical protein
MRLDLRDRDPHRRIETQHPRNEVLDRRRKVRHRVKPLLHFVQEVPDVRIVEREIALV